MRIALCDDEPAFLGTLKLQINEILSDEDYNITEFYLGEKLLQKYRDQKFDIVILDIEMGSMNGIETARKIREIDRNTSIAFLTSHEDFAIQGYEVKAERYILKHQPEYMYREQLTALFKDYRQTHKKFTYSNANKTFSVQLSDIVYFEVFNRKVIIHTVDENDNFEYYGKLSDIETEYKKDGFIKVGKSILLNMSHIKFAEKNKLILKDKKSTEIYLGRAIKNQVIEEYLDYLSGK